MHRSAVEADRRLEPGGGGAKRIRPCIRWLAGLAAGGLGALLAVACEAPEPAAVAEPAAVTAEPAAEIAAAVVLPEELAALDPASWVNIYDPAAAYNGFTLVLYERRLPMLIDMNGNVVHAWPEARVKSRVRLLEDGSLLGISRHRKVVEYDWDGRLTWQYRLAKGIPHHDVVRLENGHTLLVVRFPEIPYDRLLEIDRDGRAVWQWRLEDHLEIDPQEIYDPRDVTHVNSVQELPANPWFDAGDRRFRPGNLLLSARNLDRVFVVDRRTGDVAWTFEDRLDLQHEARMIGPGHHRHGNVMILSNGKRGTYGYRQSAILDVRPTDGEIVWEYRTDGFYTRFGGVQQPLANGNVLIVSAERSFEIDRGGTIVWQWLPPFSPTRSRRYAADHCPQLAALARRRPLVAVRPPAGYRHVDRPALQFAYPEDRRNLRLDGENLSVLKRNNLCRRLLLPAEARLALSYGLDPRADGGAAGAAGEVRFAARLQPDGGGELALFADTLTPADPGRRDRRFDLAAHAHRWLRLCVETAAGDPEAATEPFAYWLRPTISYGELDGAEPPAEDLKGLTPEELAVRREHLEALGYVD